MRPDATILAAMILAGLISNLSAQNLPTQSLTPKCLPGLGAEPARIDRFTPSGDIITLTGERLRLAGTARPASAGPEAVSSDDLVRLSSTWKGAMINVQRLSQVPDRWGRISAMVSAPASIETLPALDFNALMIAEGLAIADPADVPISCRASLTQAEAAARRRQAGIWREPAQFLVSGRPTIEQATAHAGRFRLVEGNVQRVTERRGQVFIDMGPFGSGAPSLRASRRNIAQIMPSGMAVAELKGRSLRARGVMEASGERLWMTLDRTSLLEVMD
jgi:endonuclease YncB( thermonuclease family)